MMIYKQEWKSSLKSFLIWVCSVAGLDFLMILMYPSLESAMTEMASMYKDMGAFGTAFGIDKLNIGTPVGFYGMYIGAILSVGGAMYAALLGTGVLSKEEAGHTAEYLYTLPYSRVSIITSKIVAVVSLVVAFDIVNLLLGIMGLQIIGAKYALTDILIFHLGQMIMHLEIASIGILISAYTKRVNVGIGLGIALLLYFMDMMSRVLEQLEFCKYITPYYYANAADVLLQGKIDSVLLLIGIVVMAICIAAGIYHYKEKDIAA